MLEKLQVCIIYKRNNKFKGLVFKIISKVILMWNFALSLFLVNDLGADREKPPHYLKAARYSASPMGGLRAPPNAMLTLNPRPSPDPQSVGLPVPGKKFPLSWRWIDMYNTLGSLKKFCWVELPWWTSQSTIRILFTFDFSFSCLAAMATELK